MAEKNFTVMVDDLDGSTDGVSRVSFGVEGQAYSIDLSGPNRERLHESLSTFVAAATTIADCPASARSAEHRRRSKTIREWAKQNGYYLADRGRVPSAVVDAFDAATDGQSDDPSCHARS